MKIFYIEFRRLTLLFLIILIASCASKPSEFYVLNPMASRSLERNIHVKYHIGLEKINLAHYLQRPQIVTRKTNHGLFLDEFNRWAEPLQENIQQAMQMNFLHLLPFATITNYPWKTSSKMDFTIKINISKFEANYQGQCVLRANYEINNRANKTIYGVRNKVFITHVNSKNYNSIVYGMNQNLNLLSWDVSRNIKKRIL